MQADSNNSFILGCVLTTTLYMYAIVYYQFQLLGRLLNDLSILSLATLISLILDPLPLIVPPHKLQDLCFKFSLITCIINDSASHTIHYGSIQGLRPCRHSAYDNCMNDSRTSRTSSLTTS